MESQRDQVYTVWWKEEDQMQKKMQEGAYREGWC